MRVAVLASGEGTTFENLIATRSQYDGSIEVLFVNKPCGATARADANGIKWMMTDESDVIFQVCRGEDIDVLACAGWNRKLVVPPDFKNRVMNIHPALLPAFGGKGMYGLKVHEAVIASGTKWAGCTVHFVTDEYDAGPIIVQRAFEMQFVTTPEKLQARVQQEERIAYPQALRSFKWGLKTEGQHVRQVYAGEMADYNITSRTSRT